MNNCTDLLLGQPLWEHKSVKSYKVLPELNQLIIHRKSRDGDYEAKFNLFNNNTRCVMNTSKGRNKARSENLEWVRNKWPGLNIGGTSAQTTLPPFKDTEIEETAKLCREYADVFNDDEDSLGKFHREVKIPTNGKSIQQPPHKIPQAIEAEVDAEINKMVEDGIIEPNDDHRGFNTPIHAVKKKNGKIRLVLNFKRTVNKILSE